MLNLQKPNNAILITLATIALIGLLAAWDAMTRWGAIIAGVYAVAAILSATAWTVAVVVRIGYGLRRVRSQHAISQAEAKARTIAIADESSLNQVRTMSKARILAAKARKAEREAELFIVTADRDQQILISDGDSTRKFTAAHLQLSGQVNGVITAPTPEQSAAWAAFHSRSSAAAAPLLQEPITPPAEWPAIIPALKDRQRILIVGASDAGKTTLLRWLIDARPKCLVIDPHGSPGKWGQAMQIGNGLDYERIASTLPQLLNEMKRRYIELGEGAVLEGQHKRLTIVIEEAMGIVKYHKEAGKQISSLLTDGRKVGLDLIVTSQSRYVEPLGLKGEGDLRKGYVIVNLIGGNGEPRRATLEFNANKIEIEHHLPGPHPDIEAARALAQAAEKIETDLDSILESEPEPAPTTNGYDPDQAEAIRSMYNEGMNGTQIAQALGYKSYSGAIYYEIKAALAAQEKSSSSTTEQTF